MMRVERGRAAETAGCLGRLHPCVLPREVWKRTGAVNKHLTCIFSQSNTEGADSTLVLMMRKLSKSLLKCLKDLRNGTRRTM